MGMFLKNLVHQENLRPYLAPQEPQTQKRKEQDER